MLLRMALNSLNPRLRPFAGQLFGPFAGQIQKDFAARET